MKSESNLPLVMVVLLAVSACAFGYSGGDGSAENPYKIATPNDMNEIGANPGDWGNHFVLTDDINLADYTGTQFNIIGNESTPFTGVFDGNDHTISNFTYDADSSHLGLFGYVAGPVGEIKNLGLINVNVHGNGSIAALVASVSGGGLISNCYVEGGSVSGSYVEIGGLVATNSGSTIQDSHVTANVTGYFGTVGGLVGSNSGTISNCYATGYVDGQLYQTGGLVGYNSGSIEYSYATGNVDADGWFVGGLVGENSGSIECCYAMGDCEGLSQVGGLSGTNESGGTVACSFATGWILSQQVDVGGLIGSNSGSLSNCYARGDVGVMFSSIGGLVGDNTGTIDRCYSTGRIVYAQWGYGGLVGTGSASAVTNSFWDRDTSGLQVSAGGICKTTSSMKRKHTYTYWGEWDFVGETGNGAEDIWTIHETVDYPKHVWKLVNFLGWYEIDLLDYAFFTNYWQDTNCGDANDCDGTDLDFSDKVDWADLKIFCDHWLEGTEP